MVGHKKKVMVTRGLIRVCLGVKLCLILVCVSSLVCLCRKSKWSALQEIGIVSLDLKRDDAPHLCPTSLPSEPPTPNR